MAVPKRQYAANVRKYYLYTALFQFLTWLGAAIWVIYLQQRRGLSLTQVTLVDVAFWLAMAVGEVPTGIVADTAGRKTSIVIDVCLASGGMLLYGLAPTFLLFIVANVIWGLAFTFLSGAQEALLYESLKLDSRQDEYVKISGRASAIGQAMTAVSSMVGGFLGTIDLSLPFIVAAILGLVTLVVVLTFEEPRQADATQSSRIDYRAVIRQSTSLMKTQPRLRHAILYLMFVPLTSFALTVIFLQPQALALGVPVGAIGFFVLLCNGAGTVGSLAAFRADERFGTGRVMAGVPLLLLTGLVFMIFFQTPVVLLVFALVSLFTALVRPLILDIIQRVTSDEVRATVLSFQSLLFTLVIAIVELTLGVIADQWGLTAVYVGLATLLGISGLALLMTRPSSLPEPVLD